MIRLLVSSGRGPAECRIAVRKTVAALAAEAASFGLETDCLEGPNADGHGYRANWTRSPPGTTRMLRMIALSAAGP